MLPSAGGGPPVPPVVWTGWVLAFGAIAAGFGYQAFRNDAVQVDDEGVWRAGRRADTLVRWQEVVDIRERPSIGLLTLRDGQGRSRLRILGSVTSSPLLIERILQRAALQPVSWKGRRVPATVYTLGNDLFFVAIAGLLGWGVWEAWPADAVVAAMLLLTTIFWSYLYAKAVRYVTVRDDAVQIRWLLGRLVIDRDDVMNIVLASDSLAGGRRHGKRFVRLHLKGRRALELRLPSGSVVEMYRMLKAWHRSPDAQLTGV